jgi:cell division transport system permease protein
VKRHTSTAASLVDEAVQSLWRARGMTALSVLLIAVSLYLVGTFLLVAENLRGLADAVRDQTAVTVYVRPAAAEADWQALEKVAMESRLAASVRRVSPEEARKRFEKSWQALAPAAGTLTTNPFPSSLEIDLEKDAASSKALPALLANLAAQRAAEEVQFDVEWIRRLRGAVAVLRSAGLALGVLLALGTAFTIANVVRLTILLHRDEIEILRLVGAPELLIRGPFVLGGLAQGLLGGLLALGLLSLSYQGLLHYAEVTKNPLLGVFALRFLPPAGAVELVLGGVFSGLLGGAVAAQRRNLEAS